MSPENPQNDKQPMAKQELESLSPLLASLHKKEVPTPAQGYFDGLANKTIHTAKVAKPASKVVNLWYTAAGMAVAASIALAVIFWPVAPTITTPAMVAFDSFTDDELLEMTLMDDALVSNSLFEEDSLVYYLASNETFQFMGPETDENDNYNKLLLEMIDNEMLMEDWL